MTHLLAATFPPKEALIVSVDDTMPEAGRKVMLRFLLEILQHEEIAHLGEDIEGVHKMRVGTRRLRSAFRVFDAYLSKPYQKYLNPLRQTAATLGGVRDLDVFIERTEAYIKTDLKRDAVPLAALLDLLKLEHQTARAALIEWIEGEVYVGFIAEFSEFLQHDSSTKHLRHKKGSKIPEAFEVRHVLPVLLYEKYHNVRRYEGVLRTADFPTLHELRIHAKRLRYTLDAFDDVLGVNGKRVIKGLKDLQEHLGDMNDAVVGIARLNAALEKIPAEQHAAILAYQKTMEAQLKAAHKALPGAWRKFSGYQMRQALALAVARL